MIISFAHTTPALLAGEKTVTRREWSPEHAARFRAGQMVDAYDRSPRNGGKRVATIRITSITREPMSAMPDGDYEAEGFAYLEAHGIGSAAGHDTSRRGFEEWRQAGTDAYVVRFELVEIDNRADNRAGVQGEMDL